LGHFGLAVEKQFCLIAKQFFNGAMGQTRRFSHGFLKVSIASYGEVTSF
jgi:hypothetical protein